MKVAGGILGIALVLSCFGGRVLAQTDAATPKTSTTEIGNAQTTYRLTYTLTEIDGAKRTGTQHVALTVIPGIEGRIKLGSKVPFATGSSESVNPLAQKQIHYQDVGLTVIVRLTELGAGVMADSMVEQTGVSGEPSTMHEGDPVIREATLQSTALLTLGKPVMLGSLDVPGSTRHLDIEVVLEIVK